MKTVLISLLAFGLTQFSAEAAEPKPPSRVRAKKIKKAVAITHVNPAKPDGRLQNLQAQDQQPAVVVPTTTRAVQPLAIQTVSLAVFPSSGNVQVGTLPGIVVSQKVVAAKLESKEMFQGFSRRLRVLLPGRQYISLNLIEIDLVSGWMLLESDSVLPLEAPRNLPKSLPSSLVGRLGYNDYWELSKDWTNLLEKLKVDRQIASRVPPGIVIENELQKIEQKYLLKILKTSKKLEVENFKLAPLPESFRCTTASTKINDEKSHLIVSGSTAVSCQSPEAEGLVGIHIEGGILDFWANREFSESAQTLLLKDISASFFEEHNLESQKTENSTHTICQKSKVTDNGIEVHYCTRTLRSVPSFQDTVAVFGRKSRQRFLYTMVRTGALTESATKKLFESVMSVMEENP